MPPQTARPATRDSEPGLDDFRGQRKIEVSSTPNPRRAQAQRRLHRQQQVQRIHDLGARIVFELLQHLDRDHALGADLDSLLERFAGLDPEILREIGGDRFAPVPMHPVGGAL